MATKSINGVIVPRNDTAENWSKAINFIPKKGELIVYDADAEGVTYDRIVTIGNIECSIKSSDKVRFKFGDGETNVNVLPFATTENSGGGEGGLTEDQVIKLIEEYDEKDGSVIVYLDTTQEIGRTLELQDVYPIQPQDTKLQIVSKNRFKYIHGSETVGGITVVSNTDNGVKVTGSSIDSVTMHHIVGRIDFTTPGKYTLSVDNGGLDTEGKHCYISYVLRDSKGSTVQILTKLTTQPVIIDTEEINCSCADVLLYLNVSPQTSFNTSAAQTFKIQAEYGEVATSYTAPKSETNIGDKVIYVYGRNLYSNDLENILLGDYIEINDLRVNEGTTQGLHYVKGIMSKDNQITIDTGVYAQEIYTPLLKGDKFTFIYNSCAGEMIDIQILHGHTDYSEYEPYEIASTVSDANGICDISKIKYPYSFLALENIEANNGYAIYLKYDPALSRNWTERQLDTLNKKIVGKKTPEDGEIFNDYENNKALSQYSTSVGSDNIAGTKAFTIIGWDSEAKIYTLDSVEGLSKDDRFSIKWVASYINCGKIIDIDTDTNTITVDIDFVEYIGQEEIPYDFITNNESESTKKSLFIHDKPELGTNTLDIGAFAEGVGNVALLYGAHAEGYANKALDRFSHTEGRNNVSHYAAHAEGMNNFATGEVSHAEGRYTKALGDHSHAEGDGDENDYVIAKGNASHAEGMNTKAYGQASHAEGTKSEAHNYQSHAEGNLTKAYGVSSHSEGTSTIAIGQSSHAEGSANMSGIKGFRIISGVNEYGDLHHQFLNLTMLNTSGLTIGDSVSFIAKNSLYRHYGVIKTISDSSISIQASYDGALDSIIFATEEDVLKNPNCNVLFVENKPNIGDIEIGVGAHSEGNGNIVIGQYSHGEGSNTSNSGTAAHTEGNGTLASGSASHSEGFNTKAIGVNSHSEGNTTTASGDNSHAEGNGCEAGNTSHAEGYQSKALPGGWIAHAEGYQTQATGTGSHSEGRETLAKGTYSHAGGYGTVAGGTSQTVIGEFNKNKSNTLFEIGNGTAWEKDKYGQITKPAIPANAFEVYRDGYATVQSQTDKNGNIPDNAVVIMQTLRNLIAFGTDEPENVTLPDGCLFYVKLS